MTQRIRGESTRAAGEASAPCSRIRQAFLPPSLPFEEGLDLGVLTVRTTVRLVRATATATPPAWERPPSPAKLISGEASPPHTSTPLLCCIEAEAFPNGELSPRTLSEHASTEEEGHEWVPARRCEIEVT